MEGVLECGEVVNRWLSMLLSGNLLFLSNSLPKAAAVACELNSFLTPLAVDTENMLA